MNIFKWFKKKEEPIIEGPIMYYFHIKYVGHQPIQETYVFSIAVDDPQYYEFVNAHKIEMTIPIKELPKIYKYETCGWLHIRTPINLIQPAPNFSWYKGDIFKKRVDIEWLTKPTPFSPYTYC